MKYKGQLEEMVIDSEDTEINLSGFRKDRDDLLVWIDLTPLAECKNLKALNLEHNQIYSIDLAPLASCAQLQVLNLGGNMLQKLDLTPLASCHQLQVLKLDANSISDLDLSPLSECHDLEELDIHYNSFKYIDLSPLSSCKKFRSLGLASLSLRRLDLSPLSSLTNLRTLGLQQLKIEADVTSLSALPHLKIEFEWPPRPPPAPPEERIGRELTYKTEEGTKTYRLDSAETSVHLTNKKMTEIDLSPLAGCTTLQTVDLRNNRLRSIDLSPLSSCTNLKSLRLDSNWLDDIDLQPLSSCKNLETLSVKDNARINHLDLSPLFKCSSLSALKYTILKGDDGVNVLTARTAIRERGAFPPALKDLPYIIWTDTLASCEFCNTRDVRYTCSFCTEKEVFPRFLCLGCMFKILQDPKEHKTQIFDGAYLRTWTRVDGIERFLCPECAMKAFEGGRGKIKERYRAAKNMVDKWQRSGKT